MFKLFRFCTGTYHKNFIYLNYCKLFSKNASGFLVGGQSVKHCIFIELYIKLQ